MNTTTLSTANATNALRGAQNTKPKSALLPSIITGQLAGLIMAVVVMLVFALFLGKSFLYPVQVIGSALLGESALIGLNFTAILIGLVLHQLGPSLLWGTVFSKLIGASTEQDATVSRSIKIGLVIGIISMVGPYLLIPTLMKTLHGVDIWNREVPLFWDWAAHIVFGISFGLYPKVVSKFSRAAH